MPPRYLPLILTPGLRKFKLVTKQKGFLEDDGMHNGTINSAEETVQNADPVAESNRNDNSMHALTDTTETSRGKFETHTLGAESWSTSL